MREAQPRGRTILVVDDDPDIRLLVAEVLGEAGFDVATADDGAEALRFLALSRPAAIVLDMRMPVVDGWEFAHAYRARPGPHAPIIAATAEHDARRCAEEIGAAAYLAKPFEIESLVQTVEQVCARPSRRARRQSAA